MRRITGTDLVSSHFPAAQRISNERLRRSIDAEHTNGWHAAYMPTTRAPDRLIVLLREPHALSVVFDLVLNGGSATLPLEFVEQRLGTKIGSLAARDRLSSHGLIICDVDPATITLEGGCPRLARVINYPRYGESLRGWLTRNIVKDVLGLPQSPKRIRADRRLEAALLLDGLDINACDICRGGEFVHLVSRWTVAEKLNGRKVA